MRSAMEGLQVSLTKMSSKSRMWVARKVYFETLNRKFSPLIGCYLFKNGRGRNLRIDSRGSVLCEFSSPIKPNVLLT